MRQNRCIRVIFWFPKQHDRSCLDWVHLSSVPCLHPFQWSLESSRIWYWWTYLQGRNRDADIKNGLVDPAEEGEGGMNWESNIGIYSLPRAKWVPCWLIWWRICLQCKRPGFNPWVGKVPWSTEWLPTLRFWPGEFHGLSSPWGCKESDMTEWLLLSCVQ